MTKIPEISYKGSLENIIRFEWHDDDDFDNTIDRAVIALIEKLAFLRKYPVIRRVYFAAFFLGAFFEFRAFILQETREFYSHYFYGVLKKFGCTEVFVE